MSFPNGELLDAQAHLFNLVLSFITSASLKCDIELDIPDIIHKHGRPMTISELVDALPINKARASTCVPRLMRVLVHFGLFIKSKLHPQNDQEGYLLTPAGRLLRKDDPFTAVPFLLAMVDPILIAPWHFLSQWFQSDRPTPFEMAHGKTFWDYAVHEPRLNQFFNEAMASDSKLVTSVVIRDCRQVFEGINSLVDVGGGSGAVAKVIADGFHHLHCTVLDLPHVVDGLQRTNNLSYVGRDMFDYIPPPDAVLLKWIWHDWNDEECVKILKKCKEALPVKDKRGKVIIMDMVVDNLEGDDESIKTQLFFDMVLMVDFTGRERNEKEWAKLFFNAGFSDYKITAITKSRSLIEVYP